MSALGTIVLEIARRPEQMAALRADPSLIASAVEEGLRWRAPIAYLNRVTTCESEVSGVTIPNESLVLGAINSANRDADVFERPNDFDITRNPNKHLSFGTGVHLCIGAALARAELQIALAALIDELPDLRLSDDAEPRYTGLFSNALEALPLEFSSC
jgi:cytochrome P450